MKSFIPFIIITLLVACSSNKNMSNQNNNKVASQFEYFDAASNRYYLLGDTLSYFPVKPIESSSGIYNGGEIKRRFLPVEEKDALLSLVQKVAADTKAHTTTKNKTDCVLKIIETGKYTKRTDYTLLYQAKANLQLEQFLKESLNRQ